jgi:hypothetical protein
MTTKKVYHFTSTSHLPWILKAHKLVPNHDNSLDFPSSYLLWATTNAEGDRSIPSIFKRTYIDEWERDFVRLVRFTLDIGDFEPWLEIIKRFPQWAPKDVKLTELEDDSVWDIPPSTWQCRTEPLPMERWLAVETRTQSGPWKPVDYSDWDFVAEYWRMPLNECDAHRLEAQSKRRISYSKTRSNKPK